ncbi:MAG: hypothetical protein AAF998_11740 [Bacteroidota bacterium]
MKIRAFIVIGLFGGLFGEVSAQSIAPGYLGRTTFVEYSLSGITPFGDNDFLSDELTNYRGDKDGFAGSGFYLRARHNVGIYRCLNHRTAIGAQVSAMRMGYRSGFFSFADNFLDTLGQYRVLGAGIRIRSYYFLSRGNIAPVGPYTEFGWTMYAPRLRPRGAADEEPVLRGLYSSVEWITGYQAVAFDRFLLGIAVELQAPFLNRALRPLTVSRVDGADGELTFNAMRRHTALNLRLSISGLLF